MVHGVSEIRKEIKALRESERHYRTLFASIDSAFCIIQVIFDDSGRPVDYRFLETNAVFEMHTGLRDAAGKTMRELEPRHEDHWFEIYGDVALTGVSQRFTENARFLDDRTFTVKAFRVGAPEERKVAVIFNDITAQRDAERALEELNGSLERRVAERTARLETLTSQLRSLANTLTETEQRERRRLAAIIHDDLQQLLIAARLRITGLQTADNETAFTESRDTAVSLLNQAIEEARSLTVQLRPPALYESGLISATRWLATWVRENYGLKVELDLDPRAEPGSELVSVSLFESAKELLLNVVKYAEVDGARVALKKIDGDRLQLTVSDGGRGFDPAKMEPEPGHHGGFGLLNISERMRAIHGKYQIRSAPGQGTTVALTAPLDTPAGSGADGAAPQVGEPPIMVYEPGADIPEGFVRVLIADDHSMVRQGIAHLIEKAPGLLVVKEVSDGAAAVEFTTRLRPDVVVMDVNMPKMNGITATKAIAESVPGVNVIGMSIHADESTRQAMLDAGAKDYLPKDGPAEGLIATIRRVAGRSEASAGH